MLKWIANKINEFRVNRILSREASPKTILRMAAELHELSQAAEQICNKSPSVLDKIHGIRQESERLRDLAGQPRFRRISPHKRFMLRQGLIKSKNQLFETMQTAETPTNRVQ